MIAHLGSWKWPVAALVCACSLIPISLLTFIQYNEATWSIWATEKQVVPYISRTFVSVYLWGWALPAAVFVWMLATTLKPQVSVVKFAWCGFVLGTLHLLWLAYGVAAIYLANQDFKM